MKTLIRNIYIFKMEHATQERRKNVGTGSVRETFKKDRYSWWKSNVCFVLSRLIILNKNVNQQHTTTFSSIYFGFLRLKIFRTSEQNRKQSSIGKSRSKWSSSACPTKACIWMALSGKYLNAFGELSIIKLLLRSSFTTLKSFVYDCTPSCIQSCR